MAGLDLGAGEGSCGFGGNFGSGCEAKSFGQRDKADSGKIGGGGVVFDEFAGLREHFSGADGGFAAQMTHQLAQVLYRGDQQVLDSDLFQASIPRPLEAVIVDCIGERALGLMFSPGHQPFSLIW